MSLVLFFDFDLDSISFESFDLRLDFDLESTLGSDLDLDLGPSFFVASGMIKAVVYWNLLKDTGIAFSGYSYKSGYGFGMVMPKQPTTDFIAQIVSPLADSAGWAGVSFDSSMVGPLLLVTWANGNKVMTTPYVAKDYTPSGVVPYTAHPISLRPIEKGTYVNDTHVSSTFLCGGCINADSFNANWTLDRKHEAVFGYAYSQTAVHDPSNINTSLSDHTSSRGGGYGAFTIVLSDVRSELYDKYAALVVEEGPGGVIGVEPDHPTPSPTTSTSSSSAAKSSFSLTTETPAAATAAAQGWTDPCLESGLACDMPTGLDFSHREIPLMELMALALVGLLYLWQAFKSS
ncbi:uncharacterized protein B0T15DRAFT_555382 [Chaetomium strumarium]|uniref:Cellobiose dehydrogenase-like cytochrome domain-containing protein n=1 Tax=Chaetomium strumarium TaxID=1170767 RepID=A0AAJ0GSY4_9PEZI|nr:hypothetical protein B0T15DRAFT_555382 [Chaetomium strumarium]